jgi:hypothetical protein
VVVVVVVVVVEWLSAGIGRHCFAFDPLLMDQFDRSDGMGGQIWHSDETQPATNARTHLLVVVRRKDALADPPADHLVMLEVPLLEVVRPLDHLLIRFGFDGLGECGWAMGCGRMSLVRSISIDCFC